MAMHRALIEVVRVSGGMLMLLCIAAAIGLFLLILLAISIVTNLVKNSNKVKTE